MSVDVLECIPQRDTGKETKYYYYQEYKIACPNIEYSIVKEFLRSANYNGIVLFFLKDIDITTDLDPDIFKLESSRDPSRSFPDFFRDFSRFFPIFSDFFRDKYFSVAVIYTTTNPFNKIFHVFFSCHLISNPCVDSMPVPQLSDQFV